MATFTDNWCRFYGDWEKWLVGFRDKAVSGIEIGVYEGRSTCWLFENILTHPDAELLCIDPFETFDGIAGDYEKRFLENTKPYLNKIRIARDPNCSQEYLREVDGPESFDFIIVDGSHKARDVLLDAIFSWDWLKPGGVMIFDDYEWLGFGHTQCTETDKPRIAIDAFVSVYQPEILHKGYQMIIRKPV